MPYPPHCFTPWTYHRRRSFKAYIFPTSYDLAHVAVWDPYNLHDQYIAHVDLGCNLDYADPAKPLTAAGEELLDA